MTEEPEPLWDFNDDEYGECLREVLKPETQERLAREAAEKARPER